MNKTILSAAALLILPIFLTGCERGDVTTTFKTPTPSVEKLALAKKAETEKQEIESALKASEAIHAQDRAAQTASAPAPAPAGAASAGDEQVKWRFASDADQMTGKETKTAHLSSENELNFGFPYAGGSSGSLMIRQRATDGLSVMFSISSGQIVCMMSCSVMVRFDNRPPMKFKGNPPADYGSKSIFLSPESKFVAELKKSKKTLVQVNYYASGQQISEFKTSGFEWGAR